jgi:hypothetical protein
MSRLMKDSIDGSPMATSAMMLLPLRHVTAPGRDHLLDETGLRGARS